MKPEFKKMLQLGILVKDVDACVKIYEEEFGIGPWHGGVMDGARMGMEVNGKPCNEPFFKVAMCNAFGMEIEMIEPICDSPYKAWVDEHGPGLHHIAFATESPYDDVLKKSVELTGEEPWMICKRQGADSDMFSYIDYSKQLGFFLECYPHSEGKKGIDYDA